MKREVRNILLFSVPIVLMLLVALVGSFTDVGQRVWNMSGEDIQELLCGQQVAQGQAELQWYQDVSVRSKHASAYVFPMAQGDCSCFLAFENNIANDEEEIQALAIGIGRRNARPSEILYVARIQGPDIDDDHVTVSRRSNGLDSGQANVAYWQHELLTRCGSVMTGLPESAQELLTLLKSELEEAAK